MIFERCLFDGITVREANERAKEITSSAERDGDIFIGLYKDFIRLDSMSALAVPIREVIALPAATGAE
jgi:hypothetical protein